MAAGCALLLVSGDGIVISQVATQAPEAPATTQAPATTEVPAAPEAKAPAPAAAEETAPKLPPEQLDSLVAPIALYPDSLLAQSLVAATYPLEIIQLQQWLAKNPKLKDKALADAVAKQPWDPSIQSMAPMPDVVKRLAEDIQWTTDLGNAFLAQQSDVMDAVQRMRAKAKENGALKSNDQQKVEEKKIDDKTVIIVESANPDVIYVPAYSPTVVYGAPIYPYPPIYYPPYPPGAAFVSFSFGVMMGAAFWGGSCCGCGWGGNDIDINVNNNFNQNNNINTGGNRGDGGGGNKWSHNAEHRGGAPYKDKATANKYGGSARGDSVSNRQSSAGKQAGRQPSASNRASGGASAGNRATGGAGGGPSGPSAGTRPSGGGGSDRIGNQSISKGSRSGSGGFGGGGGYNGASARASSSRGSRSMGGSRGGGGGGRRR